VSSLTSVLEKIWLQLSQKRKRELILVLILSIFCSLAESISIAALIPFISYFVNPELYAFNNFFKIIFNYLSIGSKNEIFGAVSFLFICAVVISGYFKIKHLTLSTLVTQKITSDFRIKIFNFLLNQDFKYYFTHGSKDVLSNLSQKSGSFAVIIFNAINILNALLISTAIIIVLILNEPFYTPIIIFSIIIFFYTIFKIRSNAILKKGQRVNVNQNIIIDVFENTVGYLPEIIIYNLKKFYSSFLSKLSKETANASADIVKIGMTPRIYLETFVLVFIIGFIFFSGLADRAIETNITYLAILAFGAQKALPLINSVYNCSVAIKGSTPTVLSFLDILQKGKEEIIEDKQYDHLKFLNSIEIKKVSFQYSENLPKILKDITVEIKRGEKIAIKGETGSGKSTFINIISGLLSPTHGSIFVDGVKLNSQNIKNWQKNISIVPQNIFLNDSTILENIAIAEHENDINFERAKNSAKIAHIDNFIEKLPNKYHEKVGERGVRLSGGQRQRIGIARALYRDSKLLILDEPTNALDTETEIRLMDSIINLKKNITIIMISHSDNTLKYFNKIIDLKKSN